jgi:hypothetical protein
VGVEIVRAASDETRARKRGTGGGEEEDRAPANAEARDLGPDFAEVKKDESEVAPSASSVSIRGKVGTPAQLAVGGTLIAVGFIHLVWLATRLANVAFGVLVGDPWIYGDVVFGIGGIVIGFGTTKALDWGRTGGTWLCILGLISGVLWFVDPEEPELVAKAINIISLPLAAVGLLYFSPLVACRVRPIRRPFSTPDADRAARLLNGLRLHHLPPVYHKMLRAYLMRPTTCPSRRSPRGSV